MVADAIAPTTVQRESLLSPAAMVSHLPCEVLDETAVREVGFGRQVPRGRDAEGPVALLAGDGRLIAVAMSADERWQPVVVLEPAA
jgi:hypothetical protein